MTQPELVKLTNPDAEKAVCGAILVDPDLLIKLSGTLQPEDFSIERTRWVYEAMSALYEQQQPIDWVTVSEMLQREKHLAEVGGAAFLTELTLNTPTALHAERYADVLIRLSTLRKLVQVAQRTAALAYNANGQSTSEIVDQIRAMIDQALPSTSTEDTLLWKDSITRFVQVQAARARGQEQEAGTTSQLALEFPWKRTLGRFKLKLRPGTVALIVAGSSVGKTSLMACCAEYWAALGYHVAFFHSELSHQLMLDRRTCRLARVPLEVVESRMPNDQVLAAKATMDGYKGGIHYVHCPSWSARQVAARARELNAKGLCDVMIVDYLQKLRLYMPRGYNKNDALADAMEVIKNGCEQMGIGALVGSQVNKKAEEAGRVTAAHVRGTGEADEKANITMVLTREILVAPMNDGEYPAGEKSPIMGVRIDKNTFGPTGDAELFIKGLYYLVTELKEQKEEDIPW